MAVSDTIVKQTTYPAYKEGTGGLIRLNRKGEVVSPDPVMQSILDGRCFISSNAAMQTINKLGDASYVSTVSALAMDVPSGVIVTPLEIVIVQAGTVSGGDVTTILQVDDKLRITSGVASTPHNLLINTTEARPSMVTVKSHEEGATNLVTAANAEDNTFYAKMATEDIIGGWSQQVVWTARKYPAPVIKGPGALVVSIFPGTGAAGEFFWHMIWKEELTEEVV